MNQIHASQKTCQKNLHAWGKANQVAFDPGKESMHVLSRTSPVGGSFKLLGVIHDTKLIMDEALHDLVGKVRRKRDALLRCQRHFNGRQLVDQYKSQILSHIEYRTASIYHACSTLLQPLDHVHDQVLEAAGLSSAEALLHCNLAPLSARRDIAMLGVIHRAVLGQGPKQLREFFFLTSDAPLTNRHRMQIREYREGSSDHWSDIARFGPRTYTAAPDYMTRSALGLCTVYNLLPANIVEESSSVACFQSNLQQLLCNACEGGCPY
jgi:hypothetical protein